MIYSNVGLVETIDGHVRIVVDRGEKGCLLYGPYVQLEPGSYIVAFDIDVRGPASLFGVTCRLDVTAGFGKQTLAMEELSSSALKAANGQVHLPFTLTTPDTLEFRVFSTGRDKLSVRTKRALGAVDAATGQFVSLDDAYAPKLYKDHEAEFNFFRQYGIDIYYQDEDVFAKCDGLCIQVMNSEDIQLLDEILLNQTYNIKTRRDTLFIDIGMNVGIASLYFARIGDVKEVYSFEPFQAPFARAQRNFALNPDIAQKIVPSQFGLGGEDRRIDVAINPEATIGTSVRGEASGVSETIEIRSASHLIRPIAERAKAQGADLMVKMDCEGSEFAIMDRLEQDGLLGSIAAIVIEWHKWWSTDKSEVDLIGPLTRAGFIVFDHTHVANPHAGILYAVRAL